MQQELEWVRVLAARPVRYQGQRWCGCAHLIKTAIGSAPTPRKLTLVRLSCGVGRVSSRQPHAVMALKTDKH